MEWSPTRTNDIGNSSRGTKRRADESLDDNDRFAKRFNQLDIGNAALSPSSSRAFTSDLGPSKSQPITDHADGMQVDETKDRVYIADLDQELAEIESSTHPERIIFVPDVERKLHSIPRAVLLESDREHAQNSQMVLCSAQKSQCMLQTLEKRRDGLEQAIERPAHDHVADDMEMDIL